MAHFQVSATSLTPSRPAPSPQRRAAPDPGAALAHSGYSPSFTSPPSYNYSNGGIGSAPSRGNSADDFLSSQIVRSGSASIKEDGFASWLWKAKWLVLKEQTLSIHRNEACSASSRPPPAHPHPPHSHHPHRPSSSCAILPTSSAPMPSPTASISKQKTKSTGSLSKTTRRSTVGRTTSILGVPLWASAIPLISFIKSMLVLIPSLATLRCVLASHF
jgi:hypothetical protein